MKFQEPVFTGKLLKRYKRFFADFELGGKQYTAHVPNTGSMRGVLEPGQDCCVTKSPDPKRKLAYTLQMLKAPNSWVGVNTQLPNKLVQEAFLKDSKLFPDADTVQAEYKISPKTRLDFASFQNDKLTGFIEVKNVTLAEAEKALFPDCVTSRGLKHLEELIELTKQNYLCEMLFVIQRSDCNEFSPAWDLDPAYADGLKRAFQCGVKVTAYKTKLDTTGIELDIKSPIKISGL